MSASDLAAYRQNIALLQDGGVMLVATTRDNVSPSLVLELEELLRWVYSRHAHMHTMTTAALAKHVHVT